MNKIVDSAKATPWSYFQSCVLLCPSKTQLQKFRKTQGALGEHTSTQNVKDMRVLNDCESSMPRI